MVTPPHIQNPNERVKWQTLLSMLDIHVDRSALPATFQCPFCRRKRLTLYQDSINGGAWHHCSACLQCGDMIEFAAKIWKLSIRDTLIRLSTLDYDLPENCTTQEKIDTYKRKYYTRRKHFREMLKESRHHLAGHPTSLHKLLDKFGLRFEQSGRVWLERMGRFVGSLFRNDIVAHLHPYRKFVNSGTKNIRIFAGGGWRDILVIPFHSLPGQISGWLFIGRQGGEEDFVFFPAYGFDPTKYAAEHDNGLAMYEILHTPTADTFGNTVFVFNDVMMALKMQSKHLRDSSLPMPIVGMYATDYLHRQHGRLFVMQPGAVWDSVPQRDYVFWSQTPSAKLYNAAARANGRVCVARYTQHAMWRSPKRLLSYIKHSAKPWIGALEMTLRELQYAERDIFLEELKLPGSARTEFMYSCTEGTKELLAASESSTVVPKKVVVRNKSVVETPVGWFVEKTGDMISDAILRIEKVMYQAESDAVWYQGYISYQGKQIPFTEEAAVIEQRTMAWMRKRLVQENVGIMNYSKNWSGDAIQLAMHFKKPVLVHTTGSFGWDAIKAAFILPNMKIYLGGQVEEETMPQITEIVPAKELVAPDMVMPDLDALTTCTEEQDVFWATAACVLANVLAPALNEPVTGIGLYGPGATAIGRITARSLGCPEYRLSVNKAGGVDVLDTLKGVVNRHRWPTILRLSPDWKYQALAPWLNCTEETNIVLDVNHAVADALTIQTAWRFIHTENELTTGNVFLENGPLLAVHWLVSICERGLTLNSTATSLARRVLDDLAVFVTERHGDGEAVKQALRLLDEEGDTACSQATRLVSLLYRFIEDGKLTIKREGYGPVPTKRPTSLLQIEKGYDKQVVFVPRLLFNKLLSSNRVPAPDPIRLTDSLTNADCLIGVSHNDAPGWLIDAAWWGQQLRLCRSDRQQRLKVV